MLTRANIDPNQNDPMLTRVSVEPNQNKIQINPYVTRKGYLWR